MNRSVSHTLAVALAIIPLAASLIVLLMTLVFGLGLQCDESCTGEDWHHTAGAWQWEVQPIVGAIVFLSGLALFVSVLGSRPGRAFAALALGALVTFLGAAWTGDNWRDSLERHPPMMAPPRNHPLLRGAGSAALRADRA